MGDGEESRNYDVGFGVDGHYANSGESNEKEHGT